MGFAPAMAGVGMVSSALGGIVQAAGDIYQGEAQANMLRYQAGVADINKNIQLQNAAYATAVGEDKAEISGMATRDLLGQTRAAEGQGNVRTDTGSAAAVQRSEIEIGQENQGIIRAESAKEAYNARVGAMQEGVRAAIFRQGATTALQASKIAAVGSVLGGASSFSSKWAQWSGGSGTSSLFGGG